MKRRVLIPSLLVASVIIVAGGIGIARHIANQRRPLWERYALPGMQFRSEPTTKVVAAINAAVQKASRGVVSRAVILDTTPASIQAKGTNEVLLRQMDEMIAQFRRHELDVVRKGASGYETAPYSGTIGDGEPLSCCFADDLGNQTGLDVEVNADAIHISRQPRRLECRAYRISDGLKALMEQKRKANELLADAEPIISAFASATNIHEWSIMVPDGPNAWKGEFRFDKVFHHVPELGVILSIATPEEHLAAQTRLKASGCWAAL